MLKYRSTHYSIKNNGEKACFYEPEKFLINQPMLVLFSLNMMKQVNMLQAAISKQFVCIIFSKYQWSFFPIMKK